MYAEEMKDQPEMIDMDDTALNEPEQGPDFAELKAVESEISEIQLESANQLEEIKEPSGSDYDVTSMYLREIGFVPLLSAREEKEVARKALNGDVAACSRMIQSNLRLVVKIAKRYINRGLDLIDLVEEGNLGMIHAIGKFKPELGFRFSTYATWWIKRFHHKWRS